jgi:hypothetical protein
MIRQSVCKAYKSTSLGHAQRVELFVTAPSDFAKESKLYFAKQTLLSVLTHWRDSRSLDLSIVTRTTSDWKEKLEVFLTSP